MKTAPLFPIAAVVVSTILNGPAALAQAQDEAPLELGGFSNTGSVTAGYRFQDIGGRKQEFEQLFNLKSGPRLFDFVLAGQAGENGNRFVDNYSLTASGLGGDPFPAGQLNVSKKNVYDLRINYRQSYYYWDQNDNALLPSGLHGLTSNHDWATVRRFGTLNLLVHANKNLRFRFEYSRNGRDGLEFSTRVLDYYGSPDTWGTFLRDNPYFVIAPISDSLNRYAVGTDYTVGSWTVHYTAGYQTFHQKLNWTNAASSEHSINVDSKANVNELLSSGQWAESRSLRTPLSELYFTGKVTPRLDWRGDFLYFRYSGPSSIDATYDGTARANSSGTIVAPYAIALNSQARVAEPNYALDQGFTLKLKEWLNFNADYRFNRFTETSTANFLGQDTAGTYTGNTTQQWRESLNQLDLRLEFSPLPGLLFSPGVRLLKRDVVALDDGEVDPGRTLRTKTVWPIGSIFYQPSKIVSIRGDFQSITNGTSYTRISPHTDVGTRWVVRIRPTEKLSIENTFAARNRKLLDTDFHSTIRSNASVISYALNGKYSLFAGFAYDSLFASASVDFIRGTPPLSTSWRDQTVNRVWQGGLNLRPTRRLGFTFSGNFVRSTGVGEITGELPNFGPLTFPMATATVRYDLAKAGEFAIDLQRTYYHEQIVRGNDFSANLFTVRWTTALPGTTRK